jgi:cytochrome bd-type quinol oxidase subunit 2
MHDVVIRVHYFISSVVFIIAIVVTTWAIVGWRKEKKYTRSFDKISFVFILFLYIQLITGISLYFFLKPEIQADSINVDKIASHDSLRFWVIEHVSLMLFALLLAQLGRLFIKQLSTDGRRYRTATFYYGIAFLVVLVSAGMALFR